jgi:hypothetical protein
MGTHRPWAGRGRDRRTIARWNGLLLVLPSLIATACTVHPRLTQDARVSIVEPASDGTVRLPLRVSWHARVPAGRFAVFFDQPPVGPGDSLMSLVPDRDFACRSQPGCPNDAWLNDRSIYVTEKTSLDIATLRDLRSNHRAKDRHEMTIVLLDANGHRLGDTAFDREFIVERNA